MAAILYTLEKNIILKVEMAITAKKKKHSKTRKNISRRIIQKTKKYYKKYQRGGSGEKNSNYYVELSNVGLSAGKLAELQQVAKKVHKLALEKQKQLAAPPKPPPRASRAAHDAPYGSVRRLSQLSPEERKIPDVSPEFMEAHNIYASWRKGEGRKNQYTAYNASQNYEAPWTKPNIGRPLPVVPVVPKVEENLYEELKFEKESHYKEIDTPGDSLYGVPANMRSSFSEKRIGLGAQTTVNPKSEPEYMMTGTQTNPNTRVSLYGVPANMRSSFSENARTGAQTTVNPKNTSAARSSSIYNVPPNPDKQLQKAKERAEHIKKVEAWKKKLGNTALQFDTHKFRELASIFKPKSTSTPIERTGSIVSSVRRALQPTIASKISAKLSPVNKPLRLSTSGHIQSGHIQSGPLKSRKIEPVNKQSVRAYRT
jgi:hypothetical protein